MPPKPRLQHSFEPSSCTCARPQIGASVINCTCHSNNLVLFWNEVRGRFDLLHYSVNVSTADAVITVQNVSTTSVMVPIMSGIKYVARVSTVSKCGESIPAVPEDSVNGFVSTGKYLKLCICRYLISPERYMLGWFALPFLVPLWKTTHLDIPLDKGILFSNWGQSITWIHIISYWFDQSHHKEVCLNFEQWGWNLPMPRKANWEIVHSYVHI